MDQSRNIRVRSRAVQIFTTLIERVHFMLQEDASADAGIGLSVCGCG